MARQEPKRKTGNPFFKRFRSPAEYPEPSDEEVDLALWGDRNGPAFRPRPDGAAGSWNRNQDWGRRDG